MAKRIGSIVTAGNKNFSDLIVDGPGFRIGEDEGAFVAVSGEEDALRHVDRRSHLEVSTSIENADSVCIMRHRLKNTGTRISSPIETVEPLFLRFHHKSTEWRHMFANGGTTEEFYPPTAYRTNEWSHVGRQFVIESHPAGRSSNQHLPVLVSMLSTSEDSPGFFCGLEWSATWYIRMSAASERTTTLAVGIKVDGIRLSPGEVIELPAVHIGFFSEGPDGATNALRRYLYERVCPRYDGRPVVPRVSYDHWFGIGNDISHDMLAEEAERASEIGVEVFVVDAGWFPKGFPCGVGNWHGVDAAKFPDGLEPLAEHVRRLGMDFGLWFEPERAAAGTFVLEAHPEWFIKPGEGDRPDMYHIDLSLKEAQDFLIDLIGGWIERLDIRWTRWDYNIEPLSYWRRKDPTLKIQFGYMNGLYRVLDTLMQKYPKWMVEGCASGGRRIDLGTIRRAHTFWFSDHSTFYKNCRYMQARANRFLPGHLLNSSVATALASESEGGGQGIDDTAILSRMLGKLAFDGDIAGWPQELTARAAFWIRKYKELRHLFVQDFFQLLPMPTTVGDWEAAQFLDYTKHEGVLFVFAGAGGGRQPIRLKGLFPDCPYSLQRVGKAEKTESTGASLMHEGFISTLQPDEGSVWRLTARD